MRPLNPLFDALLSSVTQPSKTPLMGENRIEYPYEMSLESRHVRQRRRNGEAAMNEGDSLPTGNGAPHLAESAEPRTALEQAARAERLKSIRAQIEAGVYDTPEKFEVAVDRLFGILETET